MAEKPTQQGDNNGLRVDWQAQLREYCQFAKIQPPIFHIVSERRGGRTAWSSTVEIAGKRISARYWYDGEWIDNAREDAAEVAIRNFNTLLSSRPYQPHQGQLYPQQQPAAGSGRGTGGR